MTRNIAVCINKSIFRGINGFDSVDINNLDTIINYSVNALLIDYLNLIDNNAIPVILETLCQKMSVGGQMVIRFIDAKILAKKFADNIINESQFAENISILKSILTVDSIYNMIGTDFIINNIDQSDIYTTIKILRVNLT